MRHGSKIRQPGTRGCHPRLQLGYQFPLVLDFSSLLLHMCIIYLSCDKRNFLRDLKIFIKNTEIAWKYCVHLCWCEKYFWLTTDFQKISTPSSILQCPNMIWKLYNSSKFTWSLIFWCRCNHIMRKLFEFEISWLKSISKCNHVSFRRG